MSPISLGHPGTLPVHNKEAVNMAIMLGLACGCDIREYNTYDRKITSTQIYLKGIKSRRWIRRSVTMGRLK